MSGGGTAGRDVSLDAIRGVAALVVVLYHGLMVFAPEHCGCYPAMTGAGSLSHRYWFGLLNGSAAVTVFFVLSGFVLAQGVFRAGDARAALSGMARRYPRLMPLVMASVLMSWLLFRLDAYGGVAGAARASGSDWLATFGDAEPWPFPTGLLHALAEGAYGAILLGTHNFVPPLWTMNAEFLGSVAVLAAAGCLVARRPAAKAALALLAGAMVLVLGTGAALAFAAGLGLAHVGRGADTRAPAWAGAACCALGLLCLGYTDGQGTPAALAAFLPHDLSRAMAYTLGGVLLVAGTQASPGWRAMLSWRPLAFLGAVSFPLYLVHVPVMFSLGTAVYLAALGTFPREGAAALATLATLAASLPLAALLAPLDRRWVGTLAALGRASRRETGTAACPGRA